MEAIELIQTLSRGEDSRHQLTNADVLPVQGVTIDDLDLDYFGAFFQKRFGEPLVEQNLPLPRISHNL
jgi:hypothetical protein